MTQITLHAPAPVAAPRGAEWGAAAFHSLLKLLEGAWRFTHAQRVASRRAREAFALRQVAAGISPHDPSFAADLYAAADRHMAQDDGR